MDKNNVNLLKKGSPAQAAENALKECKKKIGEVVHVAIDRRTTLEFPAHLTREEIDVRIENYRKRHKTRLDGW